MVDLLSEPGTRRLLPILRFSSGGVGASAMEAGVRDILSDREAWTAKGLWLVKWIV